MRRSPSRTAEPAERLVRLGPRDVKYLLRPSSRSRGIRATIDPRRGLVVSVPAVPPGGRWLDTSVEAFLRERAAWVLRHLERLEGERATSQARALAGQLHYRGELHRIRVVAGAPGSAPARSTIERVGGETGDELVIRQAARERRSIRRLLVDWLRLRAAEAIDEAVERHAAALGVGPAAVALRDPRTRWGSASRTGRIMLSWRLVMAPPGSLESVVVHELAHLRVFGHGPRFWELVASRRPTHLADRAWLRRHSHALHSALDPAVAVEASVEAVS